nr:lmo0937 family membrane protein [Sphingomonas laterariae]
MLWTIVAILVVLWLLGFVFHVGGGIIHLLLVIAVIVGLYHLFTGRRL